MAGILIGNTLQIFYNRDTGNNSPSGIGFVRINEIAAFPVVSVNSTTSKLETYDDEFSSVLLSDKSISDIQIIVNLIPDDDSQLYLKQMAEEQTEFQLKILYQEAEALMSYSILNGYISSYTDSGSKDSAVTRTFNYTPNLLVAQGTTQYMENLKQGDYGVGSNGKDIPQYTPIAGSLTGNSFIEIPSTQAGNPASTNLIGVGLTNNGNESSLVLSETGDLRLYARNHNTAWTRIYTSTEQDLRYVQRAVTINGHALTGNIILGKSDIGLGSLTNDAQLKIASNLSDLSNVGTAKTNLGLDNVTNDAQLKIASNLADLENKTTSRTNLDVYSKNETNDKVARYDLPGVATSTRSYLKIATVSTSNNGAGYFNVTTYGIQNYGGKGSNADYISVGCRGIDTATTETIADWVKHTCDVAYSGGRLQVGMHLVDDVAKTWDVYLVATAGFISGASITIEDVSVSGTFIKGFVADRVMPTWTTTVPVGIVLISPVDVVNSSSIIPITQGGTGGTTVSTARTNLGLDIGNNVTFRTLLLNATDPKLNFLSTTTGPELRANSASQLIISTEATGIFTRPKGKSDGSVQTRFDSNGAYTWTGVNLTSDSAMSLINTNNDISLTVNALKLRATPSGVAVISTPNQAINIRPKGDTDITQTVIINPANTNVSINGMSLSVSGVGTFNSGINALKTVTIAPSSGQNTEWATVGFFDSSDAGAGQRGAFYSDKDGSVGLMNRAGKTVSYSNSGLFNISDGELRVGADRGNNGEANDARDKGWLSNKGWLNSNGVNAYQEGGNGQWIRQINGMRLLSQGTDIVSHEYLIQRTGSGNAGHVINVSGGGGTGTLELRNNANLYLGGTNPTFYLGGAGMYGDGNLSGTSWSNPSNAYLKTWLGLNGVSDIRMKEDFLPCEGSALDKVNKIEFVQFDWNDANKPFKNSDHVEFGWKAQQLEEIDPGLITKQYGESILNPDLSTILPLAFKAIQELNDENKALVSRIEKLENAIQQLLNK